MSDIKIKVGASLDQSLVNVFRPLQDSSRRAKSAVETDMKGMGTATARAAKDGTDKAEEEFRKLADEVTRGARRMGDGGTRAIQGFASESRKSFDEIKRGFNTMASEADRAMGKVERSIARAGLGVGGGGGAGPARRAAGPRFGLAAGSALGISAGFATRLGGELLSGAGVNTDLASMLQGSISREALAQQISSSAFMPGGGGPAGSSVRVDPREILQSARAVGNATAMDQGDVLQGLQAFVGKTGDLKTGREAMMDLAKLSKATGTNMADMLDAAAQVDNQLGDIPNKADAIYQTMRAMAGQGQKGAIEIRDMASQMAKLAAQAHNFQVSGDTANLLKGKGITNKTAQTIAVMGALAQAAMAHGGRGKAGTATQSSMAFIRDLSSSAELKRMSAAGLNVWADKGKTIAKDPKDIILEVLATAARSGKGFQPAITDLLPNRNSRAVVSAFGATFQDTYAKTKNDAGETLSETDRLRGALKAVSDEYDTNLAVTMSATEIQEKFALAMQTSESKAQLLNNKMNEAADQMKDALIPALVALAPLIVKTATAFAGVAARATGTDVNANGQDLGSAGGRAQDLAHAAADALATGVLPEDKAREMLAAMKKQHETDKAALAKGDKFAKERRTEADEWNNGAGHALSRWGDKKLSEKFGTRLEGETLTDEAHTAEADTARTREQDERMLRMMDRIDKALRGEGHIRIIQTPKPAPPPGQVPVEATE